MKAATDFVESLLAVSRVAPMAEHPFIRSVIDGSLSREGLKQYAIQIASIAHVFPKRLAAVLSLCDDAAVRRSLLANLLEEEGVVAFVPAQGVQIVEARRHGVMADRFARAAGASEEELRRPEPMPARWFAEAIQSGDWLGAFSFFAIGQEANVPTTFRLLIDPLMKNYGIALEDLEFLTEHFEADERHGIESAHLIARIATTDDTRSRALEGARRGGQSWWAFHRTQTDARRAATASA
ncbi:MAG TPA: iron-containing redox enzyme family protein [Thermoanaerobaculia bacterium]|nr:iron-containing redox enzyme family protein [Thermoanaerobaculia bacterium]